MTRKPFPSWIAVLIGVVVIGTLTTPLKPTNPPTNYWIVAHPDDEVLGMAWAIRDHAGQHNVVVWVTDGESTGVGDMLGLTETEVAEARIREGRAAVGVLGVYEIIRFGLPDGGVTVGNVKPLIAELNQGDLRIKTHSPYEVNPIHNDHQAVADAVLELWVEGVVTDLRMYRMNQFRGLSVDGVSGCSRPTASRVAYKQAARQEYAVTNPKVGRYGIGGLSVPSMWEATGRQPECMDIPR